MPEPLNVLILEDRPTDAELMVYELRRGGFDPSWRRVDTAVDFMAALDEPPDVILADYTLPQFDALRALACVRERGLTVPFIIVTGTVGEEIAVDAMHNGVDEFLLKDRLWRLGSAVEHVLEQWRLQADKKQAQAALHENERRLRFALKAAQAVSWDRDLDTGTITVVDGGDEGPLTFPFDTFALRLHPEDREAFLDADRRAAAGEADLELEFRMLDEEGRYVWREGKARLQRDADGRPRRVIGLGIDVTARKELEQQLLHSQKMEVLGQLAGGVAHDFNNMLAVIGGYAELLMATSQPDDPSRAALEEVRKASVRAALLTRQLLTFSRRQLLEPRVLDLNATLVELGKMLHTLIGEDVDLRLELDPGPCRVRMDPGQLEQVVMNLAVNGRDAMPRGGCLRVQTEGVCVDAGSHGERPGLPPGRYALLAVSDTGSGIDPETLARIFEPFFTTKPEGQGTGLGLATVDTIVRQSGGHIAVETLPGQGTTFRIYFPAVPLAEGEVVPRAAAGTSTQGSETVLVVEDEPSVRRLVCCLLEAQGYTVLEAAGAAQAEAFAAGHGEGIDLLLTDVVMPGSSGRELEQRLVAARPGLKVLYMSGYTNDAILRHGVQMDELPFVAKPFTPGSLMSKVREVLDGAGAGAAANGKGHER